MIAIMPFMLYQLAAFGTMHFIVPRLVNWIINTGILCSIIASYVANRKGDYLLKRRFAGVLVIAMVITVFYGVLKLKRMQATYDAHCPRELLSSDRR